MLQTSDADIRKGSLVLGRHKNLNQLLSCLGTCTCRNIDSMSAVRAIGPSRKLNILPINPCSRSGPASSLSFRHTSLYFEAALQTRLTLPGLFRFSTGWFGKYHSFPKVPLTRPVCLRMPFLHLYLLTADTNSSGLGPFGIFAPVSKADARLSCSCLIGLTLLHFSILTSYRSPVIFVVLSSIFCACSSFFD